MDLYKENQGEQSWLVCKLNENEQLDKFDMGMMTNNEIKGLIHPIYSQIEENRMIKYNITEYIPLTDICANAITKEELSHILCNIVDTIDNLSSYMMTSKNILFDTRYVYKEKENDTWNLICIPIQNQQNSTDLIRFFKLLLMDIRFEKKEESGIIGILLNYLNCVQSVKSEELKTVIRSSGSIKQEAEQEGNKEKEIMPSEKESGGDYYIAPQPSYESFGSYQGENNPYQQGGNNPYLQEVNNPYSQEMNQYWQEVSIPNIVDNPYSQKEYYGVTEQELKKEKKEKKGFWIFGKKKEKTPKKSKRKKGKDAKSYGAEGFNIPGSAQGMVIEEPLIGGTGTIVFSEEQKLMPRMIRQRGDEMIVLVKNPFIIGRGEVLYADYEIRGNGAISAQHIEVSWNNNQFYIRDMDSTNGTFVDGVRLSKGQKIAIKHQCRIKLADEEFEFLQY